MPTKGKIKGMYAKEQISLYFEIILSAHIQISIDQKACELNEIEREVEIELK